MPRLLLKIIEMLADAISGQVAVRKDIREARAAIEAKLDQILEKVTVEEAVEVKITEGPPEEQPN